MRSREHWLRFDWDQLDGSANLINRIVIHDSDEPAPLQEVRVDRSIGVSATISVHP